MGIEQDLLRRKKQIETRKQDKARAEGELQSYLARIKEKYGCSSLELAEKKLASLRDKEKKLKEEFETSLEEFERKYGDLN